MKRLLLTTIFFLFLIDLFSQSISCDSCWHVTDLLTERYFTNLYFTIDGFSSGNMNWVRLEVIETGKVKKVLVLSLDQFEGYCKWKYKVNDSVVKEFSKNKLIMDEPIPIKDTTYFSDQHSHLYLFDDSLLDNYRRMGVKQYLMKYFKGNGFKKEVWLYMDFAYMYEERIYWDFGHDCISDFSLKQIEKLCKLKWDEKNNKWIDLDKTNSN